MSFFQTTLIEGEILVIPPYQDKVIYLSLSKGPARQVNSLYWAHSSSGCSFNFQKLQHGLLWAHTLSFFTLLSSFPPPSAVVIQIYRYNSLTVDRFLRGFIKVTLTLVIGYHCCCSHEGSQAAQVHMRRGSNSHLT